MKRTDGVKLQQTTPAQLAYIREYWATQTCGEIEAAIGVRRQTIKSIASRLWLKKDPDFLSATRARAGGREPSPIPRSRTGSRNPSPLGTHLAALLGTRPIALHSASGRVHRMIDT